ncbi:MAG: hypothetical protein V2I76_03150 [Roseobacter sp.]|jgi:hypothetical protein|nr:hypothetical protein [Roseobacter sp.]
MSVRSIKLRYFAIVLCPIAVFLCHSVITDHMIAQELAIPASILDDSYPWLETAGRYRFLAATWFFGALAVLSAALMLRTLARPATGRTRIAALATFGLVLALAAAPTLKADDPKDTSHVYDRIGGDLYEAALSHGSLPGCSAPDDRWLLGTCGEMPVISLFKAVLDLVNVLAGLAVGSLIVGMILCLDCRQTEGITEEAELLADNMRQMRQQLYLAGLVLTFGMLFATSWMYWPLHMVAEALRSAYGAVLISAALYTGTYFSLLILSFYLPVALVLDSRVRDLALTAKGTGAAAKGLDFAEWKETHGLSEGAADYLRAGLAVAGPVLAAFAGGLPQVSL